jgi:hypothetical protein
MKNDAGQKQFIKDLLFVAKTYMPISIVENLWLKWLVMHQKSPSPIFESKANGPTCHPIFGGQDYGQICVANFGFLCDDNHFT